MSVNNSNTSNRKIEPFHKPQQQSVGSNIRERADYINSNPPPPATRDVPKDGFDRKSSPEVEHFGSNATYNRARGYRVDTPYKHVMVDATEKGLRHGGRTVSDDQILNFLNKVITQPPAASNSAAKRTRPAR